MLGSIAGRTVFRPTSLNDALKLLRDEEALTPMAGCTDLYVALNFGTLKDTRFLNLWGLDALRTIERRDGRLWIGALTTYTDVIRSALVRRQAPMLAAAAREIGGVQIQNRGTIGGNVANASPAGDTLPVLAALDAVVVLRSAQRRRSVPFTDFYTGYRKTVRGYDELIEGFEIPPVRGTQWFRKVGTRCGSGDFEGRHGRRRWPRSARRDWLGCADRPATEADRSALSRAARRWPTRSRRLRSRFRRSTTSDRPPSTGVVLPPICSRCCSAGPRAEVHAVRRPVGRLC